jgi:hypothetical protein
VPGGLVAERVSIGVLSDEEKEEIDENDSS